MSKVLCSAIIIPTFNRYGPEIICPREIRFPAQLLWLGTNTSPNNAFSRTAAGRRFEGFNQGNKVVRGAQQTTTLNFIVTNVKPVNSTGGPAQNSANEGPTDYANGNGRFQPN